MLGDGYCSAFSIKFLFAKIVGDYVSASLALKVLSMPSLIFLFSLNSKKNPLHCTELTNKNIMQLD